MIHQEMSALLNVGDEPVRRMNDWRQGDTLPILCTQEEGATYRITMAGGVTATFPYVSAGEALTLTVEPPVGEMVELLTVRDIDGQTVKTYSGPGGTVTLTMPASDLTTEVTYVAVGNPEQTYTVRFLTNGGTELDPQSVKAGKTISPVTMTKPGETFWGWYLDAAFTEPFPTDTLITKDLTLYARWKTAGRYCVTFEAEGGTPTPAQQWVTSGSSASEPLPPVKASTDFLRYDFLGWFSSRGSGQAWNFNQPVTGDMTLRARWAAVNLLNSGTAEAPFQLKNTDALKQMLLYCPRWAALPQSARVRSQIVFWRRARLSPALSMATWAVSRLR